MSDWKNSLSDFFAEQKQHADKTEVQQEKDKKDASDFFANVAVPAFVEIQEQLEKHGKFVEVTGGQDSARIKVSNKKDGIIEFHYLIKVRGAHPYTVKRGYSNMASIESEGTLRSGSQHFTVHEITKDEIINNCIEDYRMSVSRNNRP